MCTLKKGKKKKGNRRRRRRKKKNKKKKKKKKKPKVKVEPLHAMEDELAGNKVKLPAIQNITAGDVGGSDSQSKSSLWKRARKHSLTMIETVLSQGLVRLT